MDLIILVSLSTTSLILALGRQLSSLTRLSRLPSADSVPLRSESPITKNVFFPLENLSYCNIWRRLLFQCLHIFLQREIMKMIVQLQWLWGQFSLFFCRTSNMLPTVLFLGFIFPIIVSLLLCSIWKQTSTFIGRFFGFTDESQIISILPTEYARVHFFHIQY